MSPSVSLPVTLTANTPENVNDLNADLNAIVAALNGGLDEVNVPNLAAAFTTYKRIEDATGVVGSATAAGTYLLAVRPYLTTGGVAAAGAFAYVSDYVMYLDPAIYNANTRTTKLVIRSFVGVNATAPAVNYTVGLYPVATWGAGATGNPFVATLGAVIAGSTVAVNAPTQAANPNAAIGTDFNFPAAGAYVLAVVVSGATAANSVEHVVAQLEMRQV